MLIRCLLLLGMIVCAVLSVLLRMRNDAHGKERNDTMLASPLSEAISQMVGIAGGIYVAFSLLFAFLELSYPQKVQIAGVSLNPLALWSMILALVQPVMPIAWHCLMDKIHQK